MARKKADRPTATPRALSIRATPAWYAWLRGLQARGQAAGRPTLTVAEVVDEALRLLAERWGHDAPMPDRTPGAGSSKKKSE